MITLRIPIVAILKILFRAWQFLGGFITLGFVVIAYTTQDVSHIDWNYVAFFAIGYMFLFADWVTSPLNRKE